MNTQCPACNTLFNINPEQLQAADGQVRCGECDHVFNAQANTSGVSPPIIEQQPVESLDTLTDFPASRQLFDEETQADDSETEHELWLWLSIPLFIIAVAQTVYWHRDNLAQNQQLRTYLVQACEFLHCELKPMQDISQLELLSRNVYSHPNAVDALIINATFVNSASFEQAYPLLTISMADVRGKTRVRREFLPHEYLPEPIGNFMPPGVPIALSLEVVDPGSEIMTFEIDFGASLD